MNAEQCEVFKAEVARGGPFDLKWGTHGPNLDHPVKWMTLGQLSTEHLENILITQYHITPQYKAAILQVLKYRYMWATG